MNEPEAVNLWNWIDELLTLADLPTLRKSISYKNAWRVGVVMETTWKWLRLSGEPPMTRFVASQLSGSHSYSIAAARRDFGFEPIVTMQAGLQKLEPEIKAWAAAHDAIP